MNFQIFRGISPAPHVGDKCSIPGHVRFLPADQFLMKPQILFLFFSFSTTMFLIRYFISRWSVGLPFKPLNWSCVFGQLQAISCFIWLSFFQNRCASSRWYGHIWFLQWDYCMVRGNWYVLGDMLAAKVVFSPSSHRLLLPEDVSRAEFFHERVWYFIILFLIWYCMNSKGRWCYGHSSMISQTFRTNQNPSWSKILEQWN